ncbi:MAG: rhodanese-like domain-containing protein [Chloroflexi bacterium]|nr:rhodanese-like domain-containing protein [Chloroflexota bacterium]
MGLFKSLKTLFSKPAPPSFKLAAPPTPEPEEPVVPTVYVAELRTELTGEQPPLLLDIREIYEWNQVRIPSALHIPMNDIPARLQELPQATPIVVFCAHGSRSYGVAHYLIENGYPARSLDGGITQWHLQGGVVEVGTH